MVSFLDLKKVNLQYADELEEAARRVINSGWYVLGEEVTRFEQHYARYIGTDHCIGVGNGLDALTLIYRAYIEMGVMQPGDEVIVPANTFIASILAITENNLKPMLVEPKIDTLEIDDECIEKAITKRTKSLLLVHLFGRCAYTERVGRICRKHGLKLVEDNAQAHGCRYLAPASEGEGIRTGALGDAAGHSFYPGKNLGALGDGGAVTTNDGQLADIVRALANYGSCKKYVFRYEGRNSRLDELQAALLDVKLKHLDEDNARRQRVADYYYENIVNREIGLPERLPHTSNVYHLFPILCRRRDDLQAYLMKNGVQTLIHYPIPPHLQGCFREDKLLAPFAGNEAALPVTCQIHREELSLPISPVMASEDATFVADCLNRWTENQ